MDRNLDGSAMFNPALQVNYDPNMTQPQLWTDLSGVDNSPLPSISGTNSVGSPVTGFTGSLNKGEEPQESQMAKIGGLQGLVRFSQDRERHSRFAGLNRLGDAPNNSSTRPVAFQNIAAPEGHPPRSDFWATVMTPASTPAGDELPQQPLNLSHIPGSPISLPKLSSSILKPPHRNLPVSTSLMKAVAPNRKPNSNISAMPKCSVSPVCIVSQAQLEGNSSPGGPPAATHSDWIESEITVKAFACRDCKSRFSTRDLLTEHAVACESRKADRPFVCTHCGATFHKNSNLLKHIALVELKLRPFECSMCDRSFGQRSNLNSHVRVTHHGERRYVCQEPGCGHRFGQNSGLRSHIRTVHLGARDFVCECSRKFGSRGDLNRHIRSTHQKLMPFNCDICKKSFSRKSVLQRHRGSVHATKEVTSK